MTIVLLLAVASGPGMSPAMKLKLFAVVQVSGKAFTCFFSAQEVYSSHLT